MTRIHPPLLIRLLVLALTLLGGFATIRAQGLVPPLIEAARNQDVEAVRHLLEQGVDPSATQPDGATALHWAIHWENESLTNVLIEAGADVTVANDLDITPLLMASATGNGPLIKRLLAAGSPADTASPGNETALMLSARSGSLQGVVALLDAQAPVNLSENTRNQTALMWAAARGHATIVSALLDRGADLHARSRVTTRVFNMGGSRSAGSASRGISLEEVTQGGNTALLFAARSGNRETARVLLAAGGDVNDVAADGNSALIIAAHSGNASVADLLLQHGANPNAAPLGYTALHAAVLRGTLRDRRVITDDPTAGLPLVRTLLAHGAQPNIPLDKGTPVRRWSHDFALMARWIGATPYWLAAKFLEVEMMKVLAAGGANTYRPSRDGTTPLMAASGLGYSRGGGSAFIKDRRDFSSYNPVESAARGSEIPVDEERRALATVQTALELGADIHAVDQSGNTALHAAASHGMDTVIQHLVTGGADTRVLNDRGQTPLALAVYSDGIAGDRETRASTALLLEQLERIHPQRPHRHPEGQSLASPLPPNISADDHSIVAALYADQCAACHGTTGRGDGRLAAATAAYGRVPSNLTDTVWQHGGSEGEVFLAIRDGFTAGEDVIMPAFQNQLSDEDIWRLVGYLREFR